MSRASTTRAISSQSARPGEHLGPGARVEGERPDARVLHPERDAHRVALLVVPAAAGLGRDGQVGRGDHGPDDLLDQVEIAETAAAAVPLDHLLHRAAEVDVDELGPIMLGDETGGLGPWPRDRPRRSGSRSAAPPPRTPRPPGWCGSAGGWPPKRGTRTARYPLPSGGTPGDRAPRRRRPWVRG